MLWRKIRRFLALPPFQQLWLLPVMIILGLGRLAVLGIPFRRMAPWLGDAVWPRAVVPLLNPEQEKRAANIGRVVRLAARYTPWKSNCFPQAIAARCLLCWYRVPYALFFGLARGGEGGAMKAHAWIAAGRVPVTGGAGFPQFTPVGCFVFLGETSSSA